jgi:hypothetical protein
MFQSLMVAPYYLSQSSLEHGRGIGWAMSNELLYIIEGVDPTGRKFSGQYTKEDADYLLAADRLNRLVKVISPCVTINS